MTVIPRETRLEAPPGYTYEFLPLTFGRGRIIVTDGIVNRDFW